MTRRKAAKKRDRQEAPTFEIRYAPAILIAAFLLPNIGALLCGFVFDDLPVIAENPRVRSLDLRGIWTTEYWPDRVGQTLYRPIILSLWAILWNVSGGAPFAFHLVNLILGSTVVILIYLYMRELEISPSTSFLAALLFALFPIHTEATTSVVGGGELLAASFGLGALLAHRKGRLGVAILLFALAVFSKESAAALAGIAWLAADRPRRKHWPAGLAAALIVVAMLVIRARISAGPSVIPPIDNPMSLQSHGQRVLTALWIQCLYVWKTIVPLHLSADYSYKQIRLVMSLADGRAWAGLAFVVMFLVTLAFKDDKEQRRPYAPALLTYGVLFLPASNILFPIGTIMGERLAYLPSAGIALAMAVFLSRRLTTARQLVVAFGAIAILYGARTVMRNLDWRNADTFYRRMTETSPNSAKAHFSFGVLLASRRDDLRAIEAYDRAIAIYPAYSEAYHNKGNAQARLGRYAEAKESYKMTLRLDPLHEGAGLNLRALEAGARINPPRRPL